MRMRVENRQYGDLKKFKLRVLRQVTTYTVAANLKPRNAIPLKSRFANSKTSGPANVPNMFSVGPLVTQSPHASV